MCVCMPPPQSSFAGTGLKLQESNVVLLKPEDILGVVPEPKSLKSMQPCGNRILVKVRDEELKSKPTHVFFDVLVTPDQMRKLHVCVRF